MIKTPSNNNDEDIDIGYSMKEYVTFNTKEISIELKK
jgi:hypothetical protein